MKTASTYLLILFLIIVLIGFALSVGYIIYIFKSAGFITILCVIVGGSVLIDTLTSSRKVA